MRLVASISSISDGEWRISERSVIRPSTTARSATASRRFAGSMIRPLRIIVAFIVLSGERTRLACWQKRLAFANFSNRFATGKRSHDEKVVSARRRNQHARRVRSADSSDRRAKSCRDPSAQIENGHSDGEPVSHLLEDYALGAV